MNNNNPQQILKSNGQNHKFEIDPFGVHKALELQSPKLTPKTLNPKHQNTINSHNQRSNKALIPLERILKPLDQDLILIIAYKIKNKIRNRIGVRELGSIEEERSIDPKLFFDL